MRTLTDLQDSFARGLNDAAAPEEVRSNEVRKLFDARLALAGNGVQRRAGSVRSHDTVLETEGETFTRASVASYLDESGVRQEAAVDVLRDNHWVTDETATLVRSTKLEASRTNELFNSTSPATQTRNLTAGDYVLWIEGSGSVDASGATDGAYGTATEGQANDLTFTVTVQQDVTFTVTGTVTAFQCEEGAFRSSLIETAGAADTRSADSLSYDISGTPLATPQELTAYVKFHGSVFSDVPGARIWQIGDGTESGDPRLALFNTNAVSGSLRPFHDNGSSTTGNTGFSNTISFGDVVEVRVVLNADGSVTGGQVLNGGSEEVINPSGSPALSGSWSQIDVGQIGGSLGTFADHISLKIASGVRTMDEMRALGSEDADLFAYGPGRLPEGGTVYGMSELVLLDGTRQLCAFVGDSFYYSTDDGATWTNPAGASGLIEDYWSIVRSDACGTPTLYAANGDTDIYQWDGTTWTTLTGEPSGVKHLSVFGSRLYVAGHDGETVQASVVKDFNDWSTGNGALSVKISTHDGDTEINGLYQLGEAVIVFKKKSTAYIAGYGWETLQVETGPEGGVSRSVGCIAPRTIQASSENAICWLSERGVEFYQLGGPIQLIGRPIQGFLDDLNHGHIADNPKVPTATYWGRKNEYWLAVPEAGETENTAIAVWRPPSGGTTPAWYRFRPGFHIATLFTAHRTGDGRMPWAGGYDGFVRQMETGDNDDRYSDGTAGHVVTAEVETRPLLYGDQKTYKRARVIRASVEAPNQTTVTLAPVADGEDGTGASVTWGGNIGPVGQKARVNQRGYSLGVRATWTDPDAVLQGLDLEAEPLRRAW